MPCFFRFCVTSISMVIGVGIAGCSTSVEDVPDYDQVEGDAQRLWSSAQESIDRGDFERSISTLKKLAIEAPRFLRAQRLLQDLLIEAGRLGEALDTALTLEIPAVALTLQARLEGDHASRLLLLESALKADDSFAWVYLGLAHLFRETEDRVRAKEYLERALELYPQFPEALIDLAEVSYSIGEPLEAVDSYRRYLKLNQGDLGARIELASILVSALDEQEAAAVEFRRVIAECANDQRRAGFLVDALVGLSTIEADRGRAYPALKLLEQVLELNPKRLEAWYNLGWIYEKLLKDFEEALRCYRQYLELDNGEGTAWFRIFVVPNRIETLEAMPILKDEKKSISKGQRSNDEGESLRLSLPNALNRNQVSL